MGKLTVKIAFSRDDFREGLDYYIDKGGVVQKFSRDGEDCSGRIDSEFTFNGDIESEKLSSRIKKEYGRLSDGPLDDERSSNVSYAYVYNYANELLRVYMLQEDDETEIKGYGIRDLYQLYGLNNEEIDEGERVLSIIAIRDADRETEKLKYRGGLSLSIVLLSGAVFAAGNGSIKILGTVIAALGAIIGGSILKEKRRLKDIVLYHYLRLLNDRREPNPEKSWELRSDYKKYVKTELSALNIE